MIHDHLLAFGAQGTDTAFQQIRARLAQWMLGRMDLCGGWTKAMEDGGTPRTVGVYIFSDKTADRLQQVARDLGDLYESIGQQLRQRIVDGDDSPLGAFPPAQRQLMKRFLPSSFAFATTLRADFAITEDQRIRLVEVNSDNVGGVEDLILQLTFYLGLAQGAAKTLIEKSLHRVIAHFCHWIASSYTEFCRQLPPSKLHLFSAQPRIALVSQDRDVSYFLSRFLASVLTEAGYRATACRSANLHRRADGLWLENAAGEPRQRIDIVLRDLLFTEMFMQSGGERQSDVFDAQFEEIVEAASTQKVLILNPFSEHILFTKDLLARLRAPDYFALTESQREFVATHIVETSLFTGTRSEIENADNIVLKPFNRSGGQGVYFRSGQIVSGEMPSAEQLSGSVWVRQPVVRAQTAEWRFWSDDKSILKDVYIIHGLLVMRLGKSDHRLAGVLTRVGPDPVVNWSRGAQLMAAAF